jgi:threonyl-tRNA synthetase
MIIIWEKEAQNKTLSVREYHTKNQYETTLDELLKILENQFNPLK